MNSFTLKVESLLFATVTSVLLISCFLHCMDENKWEKIGGPFFGVNLVKIPKGFSGIIYVTTEDGIIQYQEKEKKFQYLMKEKGKIRALDIDPTNPKRMLAASYNPKGPQSTLYQTFDGGQTWSKIDYFPNRELSPFQRLLLKEEPGIYDIAFDPNNSKRIFLGTVLGLFESRDNGKAWFRTNAKIDYDVYYIVLDQNRPDIIFVVTSKGILFSEDSGNKWRKILLDHSGKFCQISPYDSSIYIETLDGYLYVSLDNGKTWGKKTLPDADAIRMNCLIVNPIKPSTLIIGGLNTKIMISKDRGDNWLSFNDGMEIGKVISVLYIDPNNPRRLIVGTDGRRGGIRIGKEETFEGYLYSRWLN
ncbi:MAG: YCF48-related protein [Acidobacteriota bacterium]